MALSDLACKAAKPGEKPRKITDGEGLYLLVQPNGSKLWRMNYRFETKAKTLAFGAYPDVSLADARERRNAARAELRQGHDPSAKRAAVQAPPERTFKHIAEEWFELKRVDWSDGHAARVWARLKKDMLPALGDRQVDEIEAGDVLAALQAVEARGALDISKRLRGSTAEIFALAKLKGFVRSNPADADLRIALRRKPAPVHMAMLDADELPAFFQRLRDWRGRRQTVLSIELMLHTALRTKELRLGRWNELEGDIWRIPAGRMKKVRGVRREHIVPLTPQTKRILAELQKIAGDSEWMLPAATTRSGIVQANWIIGSLYKMDYKGIVRWLGLSEQLPGCR